MAAAPAAKEEGGEGDKAGEGVSSAEASAAPAVKKPEAAAAAPSVAKKVAAVPAPVKKEVCGRFTSYSTITS